MVLYCPLEAGFAQIFLLFTLFAGGTVGFLGFLNYGSHLITRKPKEPPKEEMERYKDCWKRELEKRETIRNAHDGAVIFLAGNNPCYPDPSADYRFQIGHYRANCEGWANRTVNFVFALGSLGVLYIMVRITIAILPRIFTLGCFQVMG